MRLAPILAIVLSVAAVIAPALAAPPQAPADEPPLKQPDDVDPALWKKLAELDARAGKIRDLSAAFRQEKFTPLLRRPMVSEGRVLVKGQRMRWDTLTPRPTTMTIDPREVKIYYPDQKLLEIYRVGDRLADLAASPLPRLAVVSRYFRIAALSLKPGDRPAVSIRLTPRDESLAKHVDHVDVQIDPDTACMSSMALTDADGEKTVATFTHLSPDTGLKDEQLELRVPEGTRVSHPLGAVEQP